MNKQLSWNVFRYDFNSRKIVEFNIFDHIEFNKNIKNLLKICDSKETFKEKLESELMYYFWSKREYEISLGDAFEDDCSRLIHKDVCEQVMLNIDRFTDYLWDFKK